MALIVHPEGTQVSGSIGGTTFSHNRFGAYKRNRSIPVNPNTTRQAAVRNAVRSLTIAWQTELTEAERAAWETYAANVAWINKLGQSVKLTGLNHYIRTNTTNVSLGFGQIDKAPTIFNIAAAELSLGATGSEATQQLTFTFNDTKAWATEAGSFQHFYVGLPQNAGIKFFGGPYRYVVSVAGVTPAVSPLQATAPFPFAEGQRIWIRSRIMRADGRLSEFAQINFLGAV